MVMIKFVSCEPYSSMAESKPPPLGRLLDTCRNILAVRDSSGYTYIMHPDT